MPILCDGDYPHDLQLLPRPEPIWYVNSWSGRGHELVLFRPSVHDICWPLIGRREYIIDEETKEKVRSFIRMPRLSERIACYRRALGVVAEFKVPSDLYTIAQYRRQVTHMVGVPAVDEPFLALVMGATPIFASGELLLLAERMPPLSLVRARLLHEVASTRFREQWYKKT